MRGCGCREEPRWSTLLVAKTCAGMHWCTSVRDPATTWTDGRPVTHGTAEQKERVLRRSMRERERGRKAAAHREVRGEAVQLGEENAGEVDGDEEEEDAVGGDPMRKKTAGTSWRSSACSACAGRRGRRR